ncbi:CPBP family intramembrane metalloprotease [Candidatus Calescamantes bacterium]|nr:CPBP family intramembrane metalloprotease [Candidatus Calescamantes bacterium]
MEKPLRWRTKDIVYLFIGFILIELAGNFFWRRYSPLISSYLFTFYLRVGDLIFLSLFLKIKRANFYAVGLTNFIRGVKGGMIASFILGSLAFIIIVLLLKVFPSEWLKVLSPPSGELRLLLITYSTIPPLVEEIVFRGILYDFLKQRSNIWIGILISSLIFSFLHGYSWILWGIPFIGGITFCILKEKFSSLWAPLTLHIMGNISLLLFPSFLDKLV